MAVCGGHESGSSEAESMKRWLDKKHDQLRAAIRVWLFRCSDRELDVLRRALRG
jgi:hypothetical protein